ncbi:hypothetical protein JCM19235_1951 [Vibrio maritimus]|uniref:Uncharacterized protein n=1 Tax=Vibrio maritimus TaxID=990268 RepID=A0A090RVG5_9VIBR|nr:hypothetical protein JCM19235_1951 [Vibrio maritimus]
MRSGRLRNKVRIVKREETKDDYGERSHTLELVATLKVDLKEDRSSNEETNERTIDFVSKYESMLAITP